MVDNLAPVTPPDNSDAFREAIRVQGEAADPESWAFVSANAGSGKTKVLIDRVARLLLRRDDGRAGASPDSILCVTYTKAAASEMLSRLFKTLGGWSVMKDDDLRKELAKLERRKEKAYEDEDLKGARRLFARALETPGGLRIETIHAFCARILRRFPLEADVLPGFTEIEEDDAQRLWERARAAAVMDADRGMLDVLALEGGHEGAMAALGALRGVATATLAFAATHGDDAGAMELAVREALNAPEGSPEDLVSLAMGEALPVSALKDAMGALMAAGKAADKRTAAAIATVLEGGSAQEKWAAYRGAFFGKTGPYKTLYNKGASDDPNIVALFSMADPVGSEVERVLRLDADLAAAQAFARTRALLHVGLPALRAYKAEKERRAALDFDDLIEKTRALLTTKTMADWVLYKLDGGLSHILLDEAQDTSPPQWELIDALIEEFHAGLGIERREEPRTLFVVGDDKQSIYSFQGADPSIFRGKAQELSARVEDMRNETMAMSFRSSPEVLNFVDAVWNNAPEIDAPLGASAPMTADETHHTARREGQPGCVELWPIAQQAPEDAPDAWARPVDAQSETSSKPQLARDIAKHLKAMMDRGETVWAERKDRTWKRRVLRPEDVLILVRSRTGGLFEAMINALKTVGLPVAGADRLKLADHIGVQDCLNLMRFAALPERDLTLAEILRGPFAGLVDDDRYLFKLSYDRKHNESLWSRVQASDDPDVKAVAAFLNGLLARADMPPYEFLSSVMDRPGTDGRTGWEQMNARLGTPARDPVEALMSRALGFDASAPASLQGFVAEMEAQDIEIKRDLAAPESEVRVMTVHGAKGLQAPLVVLPDTTGAPKASGGAMFTVDDALVWSPRKADDTPEIAARRAMADAKAEEEHRRLLYVALTRAQDRLLICGPQFRGDPGYHKRSWYALCVEAMDTLVEGEADEVRMYGAAGPVSKAAASDGAVRLALPEWAVRAAPQEPKPVRRMSAPTSLLGPRTPVLAPFGEGRAKRMQRGRLIHALLQYLPELAGDKREAAGREFLARDMDLNEAERAEMLGAAMGVLNAPEMAGLFGPGGRAEAAIIGTAPELPEGTVINGRVDRLVVTVDEILVIDFKTDQPAPDSVDGVAETYLAQMAAYWAVLRKGYPGRNVRAALCWTDGPRLMPLPEDRLIESLNSARSRV